MTDVGIVAIVSGYISLVGVIVWLVYGRIGAANALQAMDDERDRAVARAEHAEFERDAFKTRLADAERTIEALAKEPHANPNADIADPRDVRERVRRAAAEAVAARGSAVPAGASAEVHPRSAGSGPDAAEVRTAGSDSGRLDPDEPLL